MTTPPPPRQFAGAQWDAPRALEERTASGVDQRAIASAVQMLLHAIGEDPSRPGLVDTPERVARMWAEVTEGMRFDPRELLDRSFPGENSARDLVLQRGISFYSLCEHHLVPFHGHAAVAYIPNHNDGRIVGLSKLVRLVRAYAARLQVQERLTGQIADAVYYQLNAQGVAVVVAAEHLCIGMRGIKAPGSVTVTSAMRGLFFDDARAREEITKLLHEGP